MPAVVEKHAAKWPRVKLANEVTYKRYVELLDGEEGLMLGRRMNITMEKMAKLEEGDGSSLVRVVFGLEKPTQLPEDLENEEQGIGKVEFYDNTLNASQRDAVRFALASREVALIHGPPGVRISLGSDDAD